MPASTRIDPYAAHTASQRLRKMAKNIPTEIWPLSTLPLPAIYLFRHVLTFPAVVVLG
jgi:hypothetical protein